MVRFWLLLALAAGIGAAQDRHDWKSVAGLSPGDKVRLTLKTGKTVTGALRSSTPEAIAIDTRTLQRDEIRKVEKQRGGGRLKHAAIGAAIGFGGGFAIGAAAGGCHQGDFICFGRGETGAALGGVGLVLGAVIGAAIPGHRRQIIYEMP